MVMLIIVLWFCILLLDVVVWVDCCWFGVWLIGFGLVWFCLCKLFIIGWFDNWYVWLCVLLWLLDLFVEVWGLVVGVFGFGLGFCYLMVDLTF